jgi:hypothetical protein
VRQDVAAAIHAAFAELLAGFDEVGSLFRRVGRRVQPEEAVVVVDAVDVGLAVAGAARIPAEDVELVEQRLAVDATGVVGQARAAEPRAAGVDQQGADAVARLRGQLPNDVQADGLAVGVGVVQRHLQVTLLDAVGHLGPAERVVVARQSRVGGLGGVGGVGGFGGVGRVGGSRDVERVGRRQRDAIDGAASAAALADALIDAVAARGDQQ